MHCEIQSTVVLPEHALTLQRSLIDRLEELIPVGLKSQIFVTYPSIAVSIPTSVYDVLDTRSAQELNTLWDCVEEILSESRDYGRYQQDENAWCIKVVHPTLHLALKGSSMLKVESVQTQTINPNVLLIILKNYQV